jgi:radical SAM peptide maturase (CXXX-repeat target family)
MISICSNGLLYSDPRVQAYLKKHVTHLSFSITIDGNKELHDSCRLQPNGKGSYDIAMAAVKDWMDKGYVMGSKITIAPGNVKYAYDAVISIIESGYEDININCVYEEGWTAEHATILYNELKKIADYMIDNDLVRTHRVAMFEENFFHSKDEDDLQNWCGGNGAMIAVDWKGDIYPCLRYMESSLGDDQKPLIIGNVDTGIMKKQCEIDCVNCLRSVDRRTQSTDECFYCPIAEGCSWCTAYNYQVFGTPDKRATYICIMHKARALANVYFWNKWYLKSGEKQYFKNNVPDDWALEIIDEEELRKLTQLEQEAKLCAEES